MTDVMRQEVPPLPLAEGLASHLHRAPEGSGEVLLGRTLISLLDEAVERNPNPRAFQQLREGEWQSLSTAELRSRSEALALGLRGLGLPKGERVAFFTSSDISFTLPDMACLLAGLVTVPIYLTHTPANVLHILDESGARALVVTDEEHLHGLIPLLERSPVQTVVMMEGEAPADELAPGVQCVTAAELSAGGREVLSARPEAVRELRAGIEADDLATIIYTSGTTGTPKGVMLSHENISSNAIAAFTGLAGYRRGPEEVVLSFLPLTHIFARMLQYGCMWYGNTVYYSDADSLRDHFKEVKPTLLATVPRVLERAYERIVAAGSELQGPKRRIFDWSLFLARRYQVERPPRGLEAARLRLADKLVLSKWREALGGRMRYLIVGAAALRPELVNVFGAAGIHVLQGYGLTEASPVISFNRPGQNRPGTVGMPLAGVEVAVGDDGEILARGPNVMRGYFRREDATARSLRDGWLHTGDVGYVDDEGFITLTGRVKSLFKLSIGEYVMPQPLEQLLEADPLIEHALVVGEGEKYCAALLFLNEERLRGLDRGEAHQGDALRRLNAADVRETVRAAVKRANQELPLWSQVKRAVLKVGEVSVANDLLTPTMKLKRERVLVAYSTAIEVLYRPSGEAAESEVVVDIEPAGAR